MFYVQNISFVNFLIDLWKISYGQILSFSDMSLYLAVSMFMV